MTVTEWLLTFPPPRLSLQEGPHSTIGEDEFFDAVESALDRITEDQEFRDKMRKKHSAKPSEAPKSSQHSLLQEVCM